MATELRNIGISVVGPAPWGTHFCHFYETKQDLLDTLVPYFKAGLESKEFCLWVVSASELITEEEAKGALAHAVPDLDGHLAAGNIEVINGLDWYTKEDALNLKEVASAWDTKLERALARGYEGMRVSGDTFWLRENDWEDFCAYEKQINESISDRPMTLLCTYPLTKSGAAEILDVAQTHQFAIARRRGEWEVIENLELAQARTELRRLNAALQRDRDRTSTQSVILRYGVAVLSVIAALIIAEWMRMWIGQQFTPLVALFLCAVMFSAWFGGFGPGLIAIALSLLAVSYYFAAPIYSLAADIREAPRLIIFVLSALFVGLLSAAQRGKADSLKRARDVLDGTVQELKRTNQALRTENAERKRAEALLHAKEQEFRAIVENAPDQIIRYDREFRRTYVNPAVAQFYGLPAEALIDKPIGSNIPQAGAEVKEDEVAQVRQRIADVFNTGKTYDYELTWTMPTGRTYFAVRLFPELDLNGSVVNVLGISRDITEHRIAEEELKREKEILEKIFDNIPVMIGFVGDDGVKLVNQEWERTIGWTLKELQEQNVDIFVEAYPDVSYRQEVLDFVAASTGEWVDLKIKVRDGRVIDAACAVVHLSDGTKVAIAQDITERKQAEEALDERLRFETLVTELSAAFANLATNEVDQEIDKWLQSLAEFLGADRASFFQFGDDWTTLYRSHSYTVPGIEPLPPPPMGMKDQFPWITEQLHRGVTVKWSRIPDDMPEEAVNEREYAARLGVKSGLNIPVQVGGSVICAIAFTSILTYREWPDAMVARLRLVAEIFAAAVERKRAEAALRESEERFRQMAENIREVFWMTTADLSNTLYISPAYEIVWGRSRESLYREPRSFFAAIHPEDLPRVMVVVDRDRDQGFEVEYRVVRPDGSIRWIRDRGFPIADESGRVYRVAGIAADITERKQAENALRRSEDHLRLVLDTTPALIHTGRPDGYLDYFNQRWLEYVGCSLEELQGWGWTASIHPNDVEGIVTAWRASLASGEPFQYEARIRQAEGEYRWMLHRKVPLRDEHGHIVKWHGSSIDIEDRKQAEEKLKATSVQLRALSARLQSAREEEGIRIAREIHDELGSSLTRLKWDLEIMSKEELGPKDQERPEKSRQKISEMIALVDETVDTVRRISAELRPSALDDLGLGAALRLQAHQFQDRTGIIVECNCSAESVKLTQQESTAVFRICEEALTNVMRHSHATRVEVRLVIDQGDLVLTIRDNGVGITPDEISNSLSLGLLGMRERVHLIGGEIEIKGVEDKGTVVTARVPISGKP